MTQPAFENSKTVVAGPSGPTHINNRLDELSVQLALLEKQNQPHNSRKFRSNFTRPLANSEGKQLALLRTRLHRRKRREKLHLLYDASSSRSPQNSLRCNYCFRMGHSWRTCRVHTKKMCRF